MFPSPAKNYRRLAALFALALCASLSAPAGAEEKAAEAKPQKEQPLFDRLLELNLKQEPDVKEADLRGWFKEVVAKAQEALSKSKTPKEKCAALSQLLLSNREVKMISGDYGKQATLAAALQPKREVNCLGMSILFALVGEALKQPIYLVAVPAHYFARWDDGQVRINIETTDRLGKSIPDDIYLYQKAQLLPDDVFMLGWGRPLDQHGLLAEFLEAVMLHKMAEGAPLDEITPLMDEVEKLVPYRSDWHFDHMLVKANTEGKRLDIRKEIAALMEKGSLPPSVFASAAMWLASEAASTRDYEMQRRMLLTALPMVPKGCEFSVLQDLAFCLRNKKDYHAAASYMELAASLTPTNTPAFADIFYSLAILQKNDNRTDEALETVRAALKTKPDNYALKLAEAGLLAASGKTEEGQKAFEKIGNPPGEPEAYNLITAWYYAVSKQKDKFFPQFEKALAQTGSLNALAELEEDPDLAPFRDDPKFKELMDKQRQRLRGQ
jgi:tetratricopeptide (TPR) repeat protein